MEQTNQLILNQFLRDKHEEEPHTAIEKGYEEMSKDTDREEATIEWIEGTLQTENQ